MRRAPAGLGAGGWASAVPDVLLDPGGTLRVLGARLNEAELAKLAPLPGKANADAEPAKRAGPAKREVPGPERLEPPAGDFVAGGTSRGAARAPPPHATQGTPARVQVHQREGLKGGGRLRRSKGGDTHTASTKPSTQSNGGVEYRQCRVTEG